MGVVPALQLATKALPERQMPIFSGKKAHFGGKPTLLHSP